MKQAHWSLQQKTVYSPVIGRVFDTYYNVGEFVPANQSVVSILEPRHIKLVFFVSEVNLSQITIGQKIKFTCDSCQEKYPATISFVSSKAEYTPPVIFSRRTRDKLVYRVEAKIDPKLAVRFHAGQPIDVYIN